MSETRPLQLPAQTDNQAANSAMPNTDRLPQWDDEGWDAYLYAIDINYRVDWDIAHGVPREEVQAMLDEWNETHEAEDGEDCEDDDEGEAEDEADMQRIADEWANFDRDPPRS